MSTPSRGFIERTRRAGDLLVAPSRIRVITGVFGVVLIGSFLSVFYRITAITGDVRLLVVTVGGAVVLAVGLGNRVPVRRGLTYGGLLVVGGIAGYFALVPELHDFLFTVEFVVNWFGYLGGRSVLRFLAVDIWAIFVAPGPTFTTVYLLRRQRYDYAALAGGLMLGFFVLTADAGRVTTLVGMISVLGVLGVGSIEQANGTLRQLEQVAFVLAIAIIGNRVLRIVPDRQHSTGSDGSGGGDGEPAPISGELTDASGEAEIFASISLSPAIQFTVTADTPHYWRVSAYDRFTGRDWIRTGQSVPYTNRLTAPPGETTKVIQQITVERSTEAMPAAWKPTHVPNAGESEVEVTATEGLRPTESLSIGDTYTVISEVPREAPDILRNVDERDPGSVRNRNLQVPDSVPDEVYRLAHEIGGDAGTRFDAALAIEQWLPRNKSYSLTVDRPAGDIVGGFLLSMDRGYCVYFASAMVILLRTLDIPARFVLGYTPGEDGDGQWIVRGVHSHAWVEVYFPGIGWVPFDPTPHNQRRAERRARVGNTSEEWADALGRLERSQASLDNASLGTETPDAPAENERTNGNRSRRQLGHLASDRIPGAGSEQDQVSILAFLVASVIGIHWTGVFDWARQTIELRRQRPSLSRRHDIERAYRRLEQLLGRQYRERRPGETPRDYLSAIGGEDDRVMRVLEIYEQARYAGEVSRADATEAIGLVDELVTKYGVGPGLKR